MANREIPPERQALYYGGMVVTGIGVLLFLSNFFGDIEQGRAIGGMVLAVAGQGMMAIGRKGLAGSGVILDPQQAREDVEPWSRMTGGTLKDALDEAEIDLGRTLPAEEAADFETKLRKLHQLHQDGILTDEEYAKEKREILDSI